jgi:dipeptidyl aminopeptidase/acylaminoacyl peptidase
MTKLKLIFLLLVLCLGAVRASAAPTKPVAKAETGSEPSQDLAKFPDTDPKNITDRLEQIQQEVYVSQQKDVMLQFLLQEQGKVHCDFVYYPSGHDLIPGYIFTPPQMSAGRKYPAMVMLHGGFHERFNVEWFALIENLIAHGYVVIFPEYHASRGYGPEIFAEEYGRSDTADVLAAGHYIGTKTFVDPARVGIIGESRGGMVTLLAIEHEPKLFKVAVDVVGLTDFVAYMSYKPQYRRDEVAKEGKGFDGKLPNENLQAYMDVSPINFVDKIETPLLVLATTGDEIAPLQLHTGRLLDALKARDKIFDSHIYDNAPGGHVFMHGDTPEKWDAYDRIDAWLAKYLPAGG